MKAYKTWQEALVDFTNWYGHNYVDAYNLIVEFETVLFKNRHGTYFLRGVKHD